MRRGPIRLLTLLPAFVAAACGSPPAADPDAAAQAITAGTGHAPPAAGPVPADTADAPAGVPLPRADPAPSALFHAAYQRVEDDWEQLLYLCDGIDGDRVKLVTMPNAKGLSTLWTYRKPGFRTEGLTVRLGDDDPGAGQIGRELRRPDGSVFGAVRSTNPGIRGSADATTLPTLGSLTERAETTRCRWHPRGRVMLVDAKRTIVVTADEDGGYTYRSFDHARPGKVIDSGGAASSVPTVTVRGGRLIPAAPGRETYEFNAPPWTYRISASADNRAPGATLTVLRDGRVVQTSTAAAYQMSARRVE